MGRNECAQRAAARLLAQRDGRDWREHHARLARTHPPDTPLRLLGTTPRQLARMLAENGVPARVLTRARAEDVRPGAFACVDLRPLAGGLPRLHWIRIASVGPGGVDGHPWERFLRAWECRSSPFPMHRRALVLPDAEEAGKKGARREAEASRPSSPSPGHVPAEGNRYPAAPAHEGR